MKRYKIIHAIIVALFFCAFFSCKKDYPKDIPEWLRKNIQEHKRNNDGCGAYGCLVIKEYMFKDSCLVYSNECVGSPEISFYDISGNHICLKGNLGTQTWWFENGDCSMSSVTINIYMPPLKATRVIWAAYK